MSVKKVLNKEAKTTKKLTTKAHCETELGLQRQRRREAAKVEEAAGTGGR